MNKEDLKNWAIETFWPAYSGLTKTPIVTKYGAGSRGEAVKRILTLNPSSDLRKRIIDAISAQMLHRRTLFNKCGSVQKYNTETDKVKFYCNRGGGTWLYQLGYEDEIPSIITDKEIINTSQTCVNQNCTNTTISPNFKLCAQCEANKHGVYNIQMREYLRNNGLTKNKEETHHDYCMRCKDHAMKLMKCKTLTKCNP